MRTKIAVIGCGPAGLLAAHAIELAGHEPIIFSVKRKSVMPGTQYLHEPIPHLNNNLVPDGEVIYEKVGTKQGYAQKVYGSPDAPCSWTRFNAGPRDIWSLTDTYDRLWEKFSDNIFDGALDCASIYQIGKRYGMMMNTIPAHILCRNSRHSFRKQIIWIQNSLPQGYAEREANTITYNGDPEVHWYRASKIMNRASTETTQQIFKPGWVVGHKPIDTDCNCPQSILGDDMFLPIGRFGRWQKEVLTHNAFWQAVGYITSTVGIEENAML